MKVEAPDSAGATQARSGVLSALSHVNYRWFFAGQLFSLPGTWLQLVAEGWLVYQLTGSAFALGVIRFLHTIPVTLLSVYAGTFADRYDKRRLLMMTQSVSMTVALILFGLTLSGKVLIWHVGVLAVILGIANAFDIPTRQSFIVELVGKKDLMNAIALNSSVFNVSRIVGPAIAGVLIAYLGVAYCFLLNGVSFLFVLFAYRSLRLPEPVMPQGAAQRLGGVKPVLQLVRSSPALSMLMGMAALVSVFGMSYTTLMPVFAEDVWRVDARGLGALLSANGVGALLGSATLAAFSHSGKGPWLVRIGATGSGIAMILFSFATTVYWAMAVLVVGGWFMVLFYATTNTLVQGQVTDAVRGRVMGLYTLCFIGLMPVGALWSGWVAKQVGAPATVAIGAGICLVASFFSWRTNLSPSSSTESG